MNTRMRALIGCVLTGWLAFIGDTGAQTIAWQENWESPTAQDAWIADFGYWEIGVPTYGPSDRGDGWLAHQGTNVAATILDGNYTDDRQSRLMSLPISVPTADLNPRLRLWHWWSFSTYDYGQVQISTNNGASWTDLSGQYSTTSNGRWSRAWLDLAPYAGRTVRLGLYFYSRSPNVSSGWYVDEMVIETGSPPWPPLILPEGFEDGWAGWKADYIGGVATDSAVWEIGVPASGPGAAHSGTNCAATVLNGDYPDDRESRLVSQPFLVPPADGSPRLRFWHWWSFSTYDYGQVQISTNGGASWTNLSGQYSTTSNGRWSRAWLDLAPYAGQTAQLGLYFNSRSPNVSSGWYVDEIAVETGPETGFVPSEGFEAGWSGWKADYIGGVATDSAVWEIGVPTSGPGAAHSGTNCAATVLNGNYPDDRESRLVSQPFVVPPASLHPRLRFWHWSSFSTYDYGEVQITTNNGASWITLATYSTSNPWTRPQLDLRPYAGQTARWGLYFYSRSPNVSSGWYVDEMRLLHDPALWLAGSPVVRTQDTACVTLKIAIDSPTTGASFVIDAPADNLNNALLSTQGCWSGTITPQSSTQWRVDLQSSCVNGSAGVETIGAICFTAVSSHSTFVPLSVGDLVFSNLMPAHAFGTRTVNIAGEPLLDAWLGPDRQRMATLYGIADQVYEVRHAVSVDTPTPWATGWTNSVPGSLFVSFPLTGDATNAPTLYLRAREP